MKITLLMCEYSIVQQLMMMIMKGVVSGACVSGITDDVEDYVVRMLPAKQILYHCLCAGAVGGQGTSSRCSVL